MITGNDDRVEILCQPDLVQFAVGIGTLGIGDDGQREPLAQLVEHRAHVWIQFQLLARHAAVNLGESQRELSEAVGRQRPGVVPTEIVDDRTPDGHRIELRILFWAFPLLALQAIEVFVTHLVRRISMPW